MTDTFGTRFPRGSRARSLANGRPGDIANFDAMRQTAGTHALLKPTGREAVTPSPTRRRPPQAPRPPRRQRPPRLERRPRPCEGTVGTRPSAKTRPIKCRLPTTQPGACRKLPLGETHATPREERESRKDGESGLRGPTDRRKGDPAGRGMNPRGPAPPREARKGRKGGEPPRCPKNRCKPAQSFPRTGRSCAYGAG